MVTVSAPDRVMNETRELPIDPYNEVPVYVPVVLTADQSTEDLYALLQVTAYCCGYDPKVGEKVSDSSHLH